MDDMDDATPNTAVAPPPILSVSTSDGTTTAGVVMGGVEDGARSTTATTTSSTQRNKYCTVVHVPTDIFQLSCQYYQDVAATATATAATHIHHTTATATTTTTTTTTMNRPRVQECGYKEERDYNRETGIATCPTGENWWCLACGGIYCSRYVNGHSVRHYEGGRCGGGTTTTTTTTTPPPRRRPSAEEGASAQGTRRGGAAAETEEEGERNCHGCAVMIGLADLSVWCHVCQAYLQTQTNPYLTMILQQLQQIKFGVGK